jgi:hypothetical protein
MIGNAIQSIRQWTGLFNEKEKDQSECDTYSLFEKIADTDSFRHVCSTLIPELFNTFPRAVNAIGQSFAKETALQQISVLSDLIQRLDFDKWAETIQTWILLSHSVETENNQFLTQNLRPAINAFLSKIDFSDLKDMLTQTSSDIYALSEVLNSMLWKYPAKMVLLCSIIPLAGNTTCMVARNTLKHFNDVPPDVLADILISIIKEFDTNIFAQMIDELAELARKIHTGAALIGEPGADALAQQIRRMYEKLIENVNTNNVFKAKQAIEQIKNSIWNVWFDRLSADADRCSQAIHLWFDHKNLAIRHASQIFSMLDNIPDEQLAEFIGNQMHDLEMTEVAEIINQIVQMILRLEQVAPDALHSVLFQWIESLDEMAIETMNEQLAEPLITALSPIIQKIVPHLIHSFCDTIDTDEQLMSALKRFSEKYIATECS